VTDYRFASIGDLAEALRERRVSAVELAAEATRCLSEIGPSYNAIATITADRAAAEAAEADCRLASPDEQPLLCGIPYGAKDLFAARGAPTTWGSAMFASQTFSTDATAVRRLAHRGAVLAAKLAMSEFAGGGKPIKPGASMHGQGRNPWDLTRYSGGSSSGSGIAVAAGLVPYALGTETGGSTIGPAAFSGITGLRPSYGIIPRGGVMTLSWSLDKVGVLARSAEEIAIVMDALAGPLRNAGRSFVEEATTAPDRGAIRVALAATELDEAAPSIRPALERGFAELRALYPRILEIEFDRTPRYIPALEDVVRVEGAFGLREHLVREDFAMSDDRQLQTLRSGLDVPSAQYLEAVRVTVPQAKRAFEAVFAQADLIVSASRVDIAPRLDQERPPRDATKLSDLLRAAGNLAGVPGLSIPCGLSEEGLPVALQILGPAGSDALLLSVGAAFQRATEHHLRRPPELAA
jgi:aspartyl-tRNA(Asn)/glutamyl-tRNA(Gln) amidotransferase subunit A